MDLHEFETVLGVHFLDEALLRQALTHRSFVNEAPEPVTDNERLEFLGDAILDFIVGEYVFRRFPAENEGALTKLRSALVRAESLAELAHICRIGDFLLIGRGEDARGERHRITILSRAFEALVGAIYLDQGLEVLRVFLQPHLDQRLEFIMTNELHKDARSILQERSQAELHFTPRYRVIEEIGPEHGREYLVEVTIADRVMGHGKGNSKRNASHVAAREILDRIEASGWSAELLELAAQQRKDNHKPAE